MREEINDMLIYIRIFINHLLKKILKLRKLHCGLTVYKTKKGYSKKFFSKLVSLLIGRTVAYRFNNLSGNYVMVIKFLNVPNFEVLCQYVFDFCCSFKRVLIDLPYRLRTIKGK